MSYSFNFSPVVNRIDQLLDGLVVTACLSIAAIVLGFLLGIAGALAMRSGRAWLRRGTRLYVEAIRNTPLLAQLFFVYFGLPGLGLRLDAVPAALITLVINLGAYCTEIVRGGLDAVPRGQTDAGRALGLTGLQVLLLVVMKPALKVMYPALASQFTLLMLATSIVNQIGVPDLFYMASSINSVTYRSFEVYTVSCLFYLAAALAMRLALALLYRIIFRGRVERVMQTVVATP